MKRNRVVDRSKAGFREREILDHMATIVPFTAPKPHDCIKIVDDKGNSCVYDFLTNTFVG